MHLNDAKSLPRPQVDINVLPMIDIMLVLLVIFMILSLRPPIAPFQLPPPADEASPGPPAPAIVLELPDEGGFRLNGSPVDDTDLEARLTEVYAGRPNKTLLMSTGRSRSYAEVIAVYGMALGAGVEVIGVGPKQRR